MWDLQHPLTPKLLNSCISNTPSRWDCSTRACDYIV